MIGALWNGITGLNTFEKAITSESNNVTNVNTVGYKEDIVSFEDMMYNSRYGNGVNIGNVSKAMSQQGELKLTDSAYDVAINGRGYFIVGDTASNGITETYYTRAGNFKIASDGILKTQEDMNILGLSSVSIPANTKFDDTYTKSIASQAIANTNSLQTINAKASDYYTSAINDSLDNSGNDYKSKSSKLSDIEALIVDYKSKLDIYSSNSTAVASSSISQITNIDLSTAMAELIDENDILKVTINNNMISQAFDTDIETTLKNFSDKISNTQGFSSSVDITTGLLTITSLIPGKEISINNAQINGNILSATNTQDASLGSGLGLVNSSRDALKTAIERANAQFLDIASTVSLANQNNLTTADKIQLNLSNLGLTDNIGEIEISDGIIYSKDGDNKFILGKLQTAYFTNEQGLSPEGGNLYQISKESGDAKYAGDMNKIVENSLEQSKANLGNSLTALLVYQKAFEANSKSITTSDDMLQTAIQLKK
ncbi:MAG: flagellar hook-basal body complex protein [Aliarcobacter sp.]|jgi:flagellar hook protein FlgE|nr:flagellar hook-basal body complex protein [Aliarcobacter sp.]